MSARPEPVVLPVRRRALLAAAAAAVAVGTAVAGLGPAAGAEPAPRAALAGTGVVDDHGEAGVVLDGTGPAAAHDAHPHDDPEAAPFLPGPGLLPDPAARLGLAAAAAVDVPEPATPGDLPAGAEALQPYVSATSCDPRDKPGVTALGALLKTTYPGTTYGISRTCGTDPLRTSEHYEGRAVDWMVDGRDPVGKARAEAVLDWLLRTDDEGVTFANARRLGVMYLIWDGRIWGSYRATSGWRPYSTCALHPERSWDTTCHRDHVHISLGWAGARKQTSFWTGSVAPVDHGPCRPADLNWADVWTKVRATACPSHPLVTAPSGASSRLVQLVRYSGMRLTQGMRGPVVAAVQQVVGAEPDGEFGPLTAQGVRAWQSDRGVPVTGVVDAATWRAVLAAVKAAEGGTATPKPAPTPKPTPKPTPGQTLPPVDQRPVLTLGSRGPLVKAVQERLRIPADGIFGPQTRRAVKAFQASKDIPTTGNVGPRTWRALRI